MATAGTAFVTLGTVEAAQAITFVAYNNGSSYYRTDTASSWATAQSQATSNNGNLVTINNAAEQTFLTNVFGTTQQFWIGFNDIATEGTFQWVSGQPVTYTNWGAGEPNNYAYPASQGGGDEDAAIMNFNGAGLWNDARSSDPFIGIVEVAGVPAQAVPFEFSPGIGILALGACGAIAQLSSKAKKLKLSNIASSPK